MHTVTVLSLVSIMVLSAGWAKRQSFSPREQFPLWYSRHTYTQKDMELPTNPAQYLHIQENSHVEHRTCFVYLSLYAKYIKYDSSNLYFVTILGVYLQKPIKLKNAWDLKFNKYIRCHKIVFLLLYKTYQVSLGLPHCNFLLYQTQDLFRYIKSNSCLIRTER